MNPRFAFRNKMRQALAGYYAIDQGVVLAPPDKQLSSEAVLIHESVHRLLVMGTHCGYLERLVFRALQGGEEFGRGPVPVETLSAALDWLTDESFVTHEATASYIELAFCAHEGLDARRQYRTFPAAYQEVLEIPLSTLGFPVESSVLLIYQWIAAILLAKLALDSSILEDFAIPSRLSIDALSARRSEISPDSRYQVLCEGLVAFGGLSSRAPSLSDALAAAWRKTLGTAPETSEDPTGILLVDLRPIGGFTSSRGGVLAEHAEYEMMRGLAGCAPGLTFRIGAEPMQAAVERAYQAWIGPPASEREKPRVLPVGEGMSRDRTYSVRYGLASRKPEIGLDELREFLSRQARARRVTFVHFLESQSGGFAVCATSFSAKKKALFSAKKKELADLRADTPLQPADSLCAEMPLEQVCDFVVLHLERESYAASSAWHLPLELAARHGCQNIAFGFHGIVLRSVPGFHQEELKAAIESGLNDGCRFHVQQVHLATGLEALVLEQDQQDVEFFRRLPASRLFLSMLSSATEVSWLSNFTRSHPRLWWGAPPGRAGDGALHRLLHMAYDFKTFPGTGIGNDLRPTLL